MTKSFITAIISGLGIVSAMAGKTTVPSELETQVFADAKMAPSPAVICASPYGEVFVGVDMQGSLGKKPNLGYITKLVDTDLDGKADKRTIYTKIDNPRGLISIGDRLYVLHCTQKDGKIYTQQLSVFTDANKDGIADGPGLPLVTDIGNPKFIKSRGTDHSTNNIRLGIDGWIYISVGDFGFIGAEGTDGKKLSMHGGGVVRVRPDGSELETFIHGTRNVYDVAIDPFMNVVTRENTNDGVGWWIRFSHYIQSGEYGYPSLYTNFPEDMLPALGEYGSGSGTGNLFFQEPGWPDKYNNVFLMADWGRSHIYIHRVEKDGASFTNKPENYIASSQVADLDVDASGRMYIAAWDGAGYRGNKNKGFVSIVTPKGWTYKAFPELTTLSPQAVVALLKTDSATARTYAQQEILRRNDASFIDLLLSVANDKGVALEGRVASVYTYAQLAGPKSQQTLSQLSADADLKEHCIRAMADRLKFAASADKNLLKAALNDPAPRVQVAAAVALARVGDVSVAPALIVKAAPPIKTEQEAAAKNFYKSTEIKGKQTAAIDVDIAGYSKLYLIVDAGADNANDHAAWINPTLTMKDGKTVDLTTLKWESAKQAWGETMINKNCIGEALPNNAKGIGTHANGTIAYKLPKDAVRFTATGILTSERGSVTFTVSKSAQLNKPGKLHSTPNSPMILPHIAMQSLLKLDAVDACITALNSDDETMQRGALATMKFMHSDKVVDAMISAADSNAKLKSLIVDTLIRLHQKEVDYDGSTWWSTRPDPHGPYFYPTDWSGTAKISAFLTKQYNALSADQKAGFVAKLKKNRAYVAPFNPRPADKKQLVKKVKQTSIEDLVLYVSEHKGNPKLGAKVIAKVGCAGCHNTKLGEIVKGPDLTKLGGMKRADIAEAIIKPGATIAKSWVSITMDDGAAHMGTIIKKDEKEIILHNIAGIPTKLDATKVKNIAPGLNMMSLHLCDDLTLKEFSGLISYLQSLDKSKKK